MSDDVCPHGEFWLSDCGTCSAPEPADQTRADVVLTEALHAAFHQHWTGPDMPLNLYADSPLWEVQAQAVERILADRLAALAPTDTTADEES